MGRIVKQTNDLCKFVLADWKWSLSLIPRPTWIDMGMRLWPPASQV